MKSIIATTQEGTTYLINNRTNQIQCKWKPPKNNTFTSSVDYNLPLNKFILTDGQKAYTYEYSFYRENVISKSSIPEALSSIFYLDEKYIIGGSVSGKILIWNSLNGLLLKSFTAHTSNVNCISYLNENGILVTAGKDGIIRGWNFASLFTTSIANPIFHYTSHSLEITDIITTDGLNAGIVSVSLDNTIKCWKVGDTTPTASITIPSKINCVCCNENKTILSVGCQDGKVYRIPLLYAPQFDRIQKTYDMQGKVFPNEKQNFNYGQVKCIEENNDTLIVSYENGQLITYDCETTEPLLINEEIKSPMVLIRVIDTPLHFNSVDDLTVRKSKEWKVESLLLKQHVAQMDDIVIAPLQIDVQKKPRRELLEEIYGCAIGNNVTVQTSSGNEIEQLQMEINRWKSVNSQLLHLLQKNTL